MYQSSIQTASLKAAEAVAIYFSLLVNIFR